MSLVLNVFRIAPAIKEGRKSVLEQRVLTPRAGKNSVELGWNSSRPEFLGDLGGRRVPPVVSC
jgi:hypothetical protein